MLKFFREPEVVSAIRAIARSRRLTVLAGAGVSMEVGLPSWERLVETLLQEAISRRRWTADEAVLMRKATEGGLLGAAEMVAALLNRNELETQIRKSLYRNADPADLYPGPLAVSLSRMQWAFGRSMRLVTTNYDELLEVALQNRWSPAEIHSYVKTQDPPSGHVGVTHLHGVLGSARKGRIILSERDYHSLQRRESWQERWMVNALNNSTCLFLGASLTDPNVLRYLHGHTRRYDHFALFRRSPAETPTKQREQKRWETMQMHRWREVGVTPLFVDNLADIAQFVHELTARRLLRGRYRSLPVRLQHWFDRERRQGRLRQRPNTFLRGQQEMNEALHDALQRVLRGFNALTRPPRGESFALALWSLYLPRDVGTQEQVAIWASSDRVMTAATSLQPIALSYESPWTGVRAISDGVPREEQIDVYASRWRYVYAVPVFRQTKSYRLPLGAITLSTTTQAERTVLTRLPAGIRPSLNAFLAERARRLLLTRVTRGS